MDRLCLLVVDVPLDEAVADEGSLDRGDRADHPRVVGRQEADERDHEQARVEPLGAVEADEGVELGVEPLAKHLLVDLGADLAPAVGRAAAAEPLDRLHAPVEGDPGHHLGVREVPSRAADLPDAVVRLLPCVFQVAEHTTLERPRLLRHLELVDASLVEDVHDLAVDVELELLDGGVADADRLRSLVARKPRKLELRQPPLAGDAVHDLQLGRVACRRP